jgi:transcriptional regulator of acetoin/glycerol metabolism
LLVEHFLRAAGRVSSRAPGSTPLIAATAGVLRRLQDRAWPGNVRELKQVVDSALVFAHGTLDEAAIDVALAHRTRAHGVDEPAPYHADRHELVQLLERVGWSPDEAAKELGVHRATLYRRMKRFAVSVPRATVASSRTLSLGAAATGATNSAH